MVFFTFKILKIIFWSQIAVDRVFAYVTQKPDINHDVVVQYVIQMCVGFCLFAVYGGKLSPLWDPINAPVPLPLPLPLDSHLTLCESRPQCSSDISGSSFWNKWCWRLDVEQIQLIVVVTLSIFILSSLLSFAHNTVWCTMRCSDEILGTTADQRAAKPLTFSVMDGAPSVTSMHACLMAVGWAILLGKFYCQKNRRVCTIVLYHLCL